MAGSTKEKEFILQEFMKFYSGVIGTKFAWSDIEYNPEIITAFSICTQIVEGMHRHNNRKVNKRYYNSHKDLNGQIKRVYECVRDNPNQTMKFYQDYFKDEINTNTVCSAINRLTHNDLILKTNRINIGKKNTAYLYSINPNKE